MRMGLRGTVVKSMRYSPAMMSLELSGVGKHYRGGVWALREFSLVLDAGVHGLLGPNGAGKSTLMRILATVSRPTEGKVSWEGEDVAASPDRLRRVLGYLPQDFGVYPHLTAIEFLEYLAAMKGLDRKIARHRIGALLELTNLEEARNRRLGGFSGGMRQRVGIAQALLNDPRLLIVDEPTAGLDPEERVRFASLLTDLAADRIVLLSTHIVGDVEAVAESLALIYRGRLLAHQAPEELLNSVDGRVWSWIVPTDRVAEIKTRWQVTATLRRPEGVQLRIVADHAPDPDARPAVPNLLDAYLARLAVERRGAEEGQ
jgi:ABC-type multidrug transport system ATPase subunit